MPIGQESLLLISMPNSAINVSQMHTPSETHFQKAVGGVKKFFCGQSSRMKVISNYSLFLTVQLTWKKIFKQFQYTGKQAFSSLTMEFLTLFCFLKTMCVLCH